MNLSDLVIESARKQPQALAVRSPEQNLTYGELDALANRLSRALASLGVRQGSRVGIWLDKSAVVIALMQGILRLGAAYVPIDPLSPVLRAATIVRDCQLSAIVTGDSRAEQLLKDDLAGIKCLTIDKSWQDVLSFSKQPIERLPQDKHDLAYILYTSGSTGKPKGVCLSHQNALAFIKWAAEEIDAQSTDRFSNHAPFHFDLSILDIYVPFLMGACVCLVPEGIAYLPSRLINFLIQEKITVWYSVPSVLILMMLHGNLLEVQHYLRIILFAGEVFPIKYLRQLRKHWQAVRLINLYGPTETNVCTYFEVKDIPEEQTALIPIGKACSGNKVWGVSCQGKVIDVGEEGELMVSGPTVMLGYWGQAPQGNKPYATGDIVRKLDDGNYVLIGRIDSLIKVRGYRIELGEIEAALLSHVDIVEAAVVVAGEGMAARLLAFLATKNNALSLIDIKQYCSSKLPRYMIVDRVYFLESLPRNRNGKIDRNKLFESVREYHS